MTMTENPQVTGDFDLSRTVRGQMAAGVRRDLSPSPPLYSGDRSRTGTGQARCDHLQPPPDDFREWVRQAKETK